MSRTKSKHTSKTKVMETKSARQINEDPYENHRFFVNNKASTSVMKLLKGSYAKGSSNVGLDSARANNGGYQKQQTAVRDMLCNQETCNNKNYYKCAGHDHDVSADSSLNNTANAMKENPKLRYNNKSGFKEGLLFPIAKTTNPALESRQK